MKKDCKTRGLFVPGIWYQMRKILIVMKLSLLILLVSLFSAGASVYSQNSRLNLNYKDVSLKEVLGAIEDQSEFRFAFSSEYLDLDRRVSVRFENESVTTILDNIFKETGIKYSINERMVILYMDGANKSTQQKTVSGRVTDSSGAPLPGVTVVVKGTTIGIITDANGNYSLSNVPAEATLVFSFVGMKGQEVAVADKTLINVTLEEETIGIEEVVAIGYGTVSKKDLTGSVSRVGGEQFKQQSIYSPEIALAGRIAGVKVIDAAQPGSGASIQIRGTNSMLGGIEPLYVIDGIPVEPNTDAPDGRSYNRVGGSSESAMNFIDPSSIERIDILKDASATAIYGSRGANGVIIITTKEGHSGHSKLSFNYSVNVARISKYRDMLTGPEYAEFLNMAKSNIGYLYQSWYAYQNQRLANGEISSLPASPFTDTENFYTNPVWIFNGIEHPFPDSPDLSSTNWQKEAFQTAVTSNYNLNYSGGHKNGNFSFGLNYLTQEGIVKGSAYNRLNAILNVNQKVGERIKISSMFNLTRGEANAVMTNNGNLSSNAISKIIYFAPVNAPYKEGESYDDYEFNDPNFRDDPVDLITKMIDDKKQTNILGKIGIDYNITKELTFGFVGAQTININFRDTYWPTSLQRGAMSNGDATTGKSSLLKNLEQFQLTYNKQFNKESKINAVLVHTYEKTGYNQMSVNVQNFPNDILTYKNLSSGISYYVPNNYYRNEVLKSYLGRVNYSLTNRYLFTVSFRADGSSKFAKNNKWGYFPSGAFAWRITDESFMKEQNVLSNLKMRLSYGKTGGQAISPYQSLATLSTRNYTFNEVIAPGYVESNQENPDLRWETTDQYDIGIDMGFLKNRINLTLDAYYKETSDLLMLVDNPPSSGFASKIANVGSVMNKGLEIELSACPVDKRIKWDINANFSINRNKILNMGKNGFQYSSYGTDDGEKPIIFKEGEPLCSFLGYQSVKIFETWDEIAHSSQTSAQVGDVMLKDTNNDGIINNDDKVIIGHPDPDAQWGITNKIKYKNFDFSILIDGQIGGDILSIENTRIESNQFLWYSTKNSTQKAAYNSWVPAESTPRGNWELADGTIFTSEGYKYRFGISDPYTAYPMMGGGSVTERKRISDRYVKDASFIKLRNIAFGYDLRSTQWMKFVGIQGFRAYISATNLLVITKYDGFDPEVTAFNKNAERRGLDFGTYPMSRTLTFGINATF